MPTPAKRGGGGSAAASAASAGGASAAPSFGARPVPFIQLDPHHVGHFMVHPDAIHMLNQLRGPFCPIIVSGPYRTGKSTLLNLLIRCTQLHAQRDVAAGAGSPAPTPLSTPARKAPAASPTTPHTSSSSSTAAAATATTTTGFAVGGTVQACTKGIWIWGEPIYVPSIRKTIVFLDSEGLGSTAQEATFDTQVFSLSILLSSLFILNTSGTINEHALEQLELVVQMTERIRVHEQQKQQAPSQQPAQQQQQQQQQALAELASHFPAFVWVLRDFSLSLQDTAGRPISTREYLEQALSPVPGDRPKIVEKNRIRQAITSCFLERDCVALVRPLLDERDLQHLTSFDLDHFRPEFQQQLRAFEERLLTGVQPKRMEGVEMSGSAFVHLAQVYVHSINHGAVPTIRTAWQSVVELEAGIAMDDAMNAYQTALHEPIEVQQRILTESEMHQLVRESQARAVTVLRARAVGDAAHLQQLESAFIAKCAHPTAMYESINAARSERLCSETLHRLWAQHGPDVDERLAQHSFASGKECAQVFVDLVGEYRQHARGPAALTSLLEFLQQRVLQHVLVSAVNAGNRAHAAHTQVQAQLDQVKRELDRVSAELLAERQDRSTVQQQLEMRTHELTIELKHARADVTRTQQDAAAAAARAQDEIDRMKVALEQSQSTVAHSREHSARTDAELVVVKQELQRAEQRAKQVEHELAASTAREAELNRARTEAQSAVAQLKGDVSHSQTAAKDAARRVAELEAELVSTRRTVHDSNERIAREESTVTALRQELREVRERAAQVETALRDTEKRLHDAQRQVESTNHQMATSSSSLRNELSTVAQQVAELKQQLVEASAQSAALKLQVDQRGRELETANQRLAEERLASASLRGVVDQREREVRALHDTEERARELSQVTAELRARVASMQSECAEAVRQAAARVAEHQIDRTRLSDRDAELAQARAQLQQLQDARQAQLQQQTQALAQAQQRERELVQQVGAADARVAELQQQLSSEQRRVEQSARQVQHLREREQELASADVTQMRRDRDLLLEEIEARKRQEAKVAAELALLRREVEVLRGSSAAAASSSSSSSASSSADPRLAHVLPHQGLGPDGSHELPDPTKLTIQKLKSWLTYLNVTLPVTQEGKATFVRMLFTHLPELVALYPSSCPPECRVAAAATTFGEEEEDGGAASESASKKKRKRG